MKNHFIFKSNDKGKNHQKSKENFIFFNKDSLKNHIISLIAKSNLTKRDYISLFEKIKNATNKEEQKDFKENGRNNQKKEKQINSINNINKIKSKDNFINLLPYKKKTKIDKSKNKHSNYKLNQRKTYNNKLISSINNSIKKRNKNNNSLIFSLVKDINSKKFYKNNRLTEYGDKHSIYDSCSDTFRIKNTNNNNRTNDSSRIMSPFSAINSFYTSRTKVPFSNDNI